MKRKLFMILMVMAVVVAPMFADATEGELADVSSIGKLVTLCTGIVPGCVIAIKFMLDIVSAYMQRDQDPHKLKNAVVGFVMVVLVIVLYVVIVHYIFDDDADSANGSIATDSFLSGLTGDVIDPALLGDYALQQDFGGWQPVE